VLQAALERSAPGDAAFALDGFKGVRLGFRPWDRQLRQPMLLSDGQGVVATAPLDGVLHPRDTLDTLGADAPERLCRAQP
jgi:ABC transporter substrate binding protein (PQQ-dependent alcohol dehydrogenase system)